MPEKPVFNDNDKEISPAAGAATMESLIKLLVLQTGRESGPVRVSFPKTLPPEFESWAQQFDEPLSEDDMATLQSIGARIAGPFFERRYGPK